VSSSTGKPSKIASSSNLIRPYPRLSGAFAPGQLPVAVIAVLTNLPDSASAFNLARALIDARLAACVNVLAPATSFFRWEGRPQEAPEVPVLIKSTAERYPDLERAIRACHPYEVPEIIALPVQAGLAGYLGWVEAECKPAAAGHDTP
jgi:periplasmic divalent cation tolerance protein